MNLDDRMRSAHKRQLDDVTGATAGRSFTPDEPSPMRRVVPVLIASLVVVLALGLWSATSNPPTILESTGEGESSESDGGLIPAEDTGEEDTPAEELGEGEVVEDDGERPPVAPTSAAPAVTTTTSDASTGATTATEVPTTSAAFPSTTTEIPATPIDTPTTTSVAPATTTSTGPPATEPQVVDSTTTTVAPEFGLASVKCPSGTRAPLESAALSFVGESLGFDRLDPLVNEQLGRLVDEQDDEFAVTPWEHNFPGVVIVEVALSDPVTAVDIRVAQDPFAEVSGVIELATFLGDEILDEFSIPLAGIDGWVAHTFDQPTRIDRFTISRDGEQENITEVLVCMARSAG